MSFSAVVKLEAGDNEKFKEWRRQAIHKGKGTSNLIPQSQRSIGASPYAVDVVSMALEAGHGVWMAEVPIKPKGISKKKRTIGMSEFRHFTEYAGRFVNLLPIKDKATTLH